jgi:lipopolysaccharide transport system ATP-binding protein
MQDLTELMPAIQAFAEIGDYLDQPVRVYSSGMQMRLAFSVATVRRPDVLIVDEALSVGDAYFQHKSFERIREFQKQGTTLLIVSHDKQAIQSICGRALLLKAGRVVMEGAPEAVMDYYNAMLSEHQEQSLRQSTQTGGQVKTVSGTGEATIEDIILCDLAGHSLEIVFVGQQVRARILVKVNAAIDSLGFGIKDRLGQMMFGTNTYYTSQVLQHPELGAHYSYVIEFAANLGVGSYSIHTSLVRNFSHIEKNYQWVDGALVFEVINKDKYEFVGCSWNELKFKIEKSSPTRANREPGSPVAIAKHEYPLDRKLVVLDVGCRWGFAQKFMAAKDLFQIYGFDPDPKECQRLGQIYNDASIALHPVALAQTAGPRILFVTQEPACSSLLQPDPDLTENYPALACARQLSTTEIETTTLDLWAVHNNVPVVDYIKIDTQGSELEILKGGVGALQTARCLEVEVEFNPIYLGQPIFSEIDIFLRSQGFVLWKLSNHVHYSRQGTPNTPLADDHIFYDDMQVVKHTVYAGQLYWANAHYVKNDVLSTAPRPVHESALDIALFDTLGMPDVVDHLRQKPRTTHVE